MIIPLPAKVKIGAHIYSIAVSQELTQAKEQGVICHRPQIMRVADDLTPSKLLHVFLHEALHAINYIWISTDLEEKIIDQLSEGMAALLVDNFNIEGMNYARETL